MLRNAAEEIEMKTGIEFGSPFHTSLCEWLTANGVDINQVPMDAAIHVHELGTHFTVEIYERDGDGDGRLAKISTKKTFDMVVPIPEVLSGYAHA